MNREQEEAVLRVTADYVAELQAGHQPLLSDYLARYPQYADAITEFVTYYHAVEVDIPLEALDMPQLSERSHAVLQRAWERILQPGSVSNGPLTTLLVTTNKQHWSLAQLAVRSGLSQDIAEKLELRLIVATTIPREMLKRLASILQQPLSVISTGFGLSGQLHVGGNVETLLAGASIAEASNYYQAEEQPGLQAQSFREAIEQSTQLSEEQKATWRDILNREGL